MMDIRLLHRPIEKMSSISWHSDKTKHNRNMKRKYNQFN